jgi:hypothetical protein
VKAACNLEESYRKGCGSKMAVMMMMMMETNTVYNESVFTLHLKAKSLNRRHIAAGEVHVTKLNNEIRQILLTTSVFTGNLKIFPFDSSTAQYILLLYQVWCLRINLTRLPELTFSEI